MANIINKCKDKMYPELHGKWKVKQRGNTRNTLPDLTQLFTPVDTPVSEFSVRLNLSIEEDKEQFERFS